MNGDDIYVLPCWHIQAGTYVHGELYIYARTDTHHAVRACAWEAAPQRPGGRFPWAAPAPLTRQRRSVSSPPRSAGSGPPPCRPGSPSAGGSPPRQPLLRRPPPPPPPALRGALPLPSSPRCPWLGETRGRRAASAPCVPVRTPAARAAAGAGAAARRAGGGVPGLGAGHRYPERQARFSPDRG